MSKGTERSASAGVNISKATIREDILQSFPGLFGTMTINGREVNVEQDQDAMSFVLEQGLRSMPQIFRNGELFVAGIYWTYATGRGWYTL